MKDADIDYSDIPPLGKEFLKKAAVPWPPPKKQLTIRLDTDVLAWLRAAGRGYQTRIIGFSGPLWKVSRSGDTVRRRPRRRVPAAGGNHPEKGPARGRAGGRPL